MFACPSLSIAKAAEAAKAVDASRAASIATSTEEALAAAKAGETTRAAEATSTCEGEFGGCFFSGTPVATEFGHKSIESITAEDRVWACDLVTSRWELRPIVETYVTEYVGQKIRTKVAGEWIESTWHHPIWVVDGHDLADRPRPEHVKLAETAGATVPGRWVDAGDLRVGDSLLLKDGRTAPIEAIEVHFAVAKVYNFQVEGLHNYAVGNVEALVHNNAVCPGSSTQSTAGAKRGPKTDPTAPHNAKIRSEADTLVSEGNQIIAGGGQKPEKLVRTPGGNKEGRRPDIVYQTPNGELRGRNIGKTKADGSPVTREQNALNDLNGKGGLPTDFVAYDSY